MYELKEIPVENNNSIFANAENNFITREEFDKAIAEVRGLIAPAAKPSNETAPKPQINF